MVSVSMRLNPKDLRLAGEEADQVLLGLRELVKVGSVSHGNRPVLNPRHLPSEGFAHQAAHASKL